MWGFLSGIVDKLTDIVEGIFSLPSLIVDGITKYLNPFSEDFILIPIIDFFTELLSYLNPFSEDFILKILFDWIAGLLEDLFVPDTQLINQQFNNTISNLKGRIGITMYNLDNLFDTSAKPTDVTADYTIHGLSTMTLPFANYKYLADGVNFFRPFIRGLIVLLLFIFNVRQLMSLFGLSTGEIIGYSPGKGGKDT